MHFQPSEPRHLVKALHNEGEKAWYERPLWETISDWWSGSSTKTPPAPGQTYGPTTPDGTPVPKGSAYDAILAELNRMYGPLTGVGYRDAAGSGNYLYRQYSDGRIFIQKSGYTGPKTVQAQNQLPAALAGGGLIDRPWFLPAVIVGGSALIGAGIIWGPALFKRKGKKKKS